MLLLDAESVDCSKIGHIKPKQKEGSFSDHQERFFFLFIPPFFVGRTVFLVSGTERRFF